MTQAVRPLQGYKRHITSEFLADRYPYLEEINGHLKEDDVSMAMGGRLFPRLVEQLKLPTMAPEKLIEALCTICDLCSHQENKSAAIGSDVVAAATHLLMHESVPVRREAARVLSSMAQLIGGRGLMPLGSSNMSRKLTDAVAAGPTLPRLVKLLLGCDDELVKRNVAEAFRSLTVFRDGCQQAVDQGTVKGMAQYLCATLPDLPMSPPLSLCLLYLLRTLAAVTMYAENGTRELFGIGLLAKTIAFLGRIPKDSGLPAVTQEDSMETVRQALRLLWHCGNDPRGRREMLQASGVAVISEYLKHGDIKVREAAVCALNVISLETRGKEDVLRCSVEPLAALLHSDQETAYLHETCVQLCRCAAELPAFRFAFARHVLGSVWLLEKIFGTAALAAVSPLLEPTEDEDTRTQAAHVAAHFLQRREPAPGDLIRVPPVSPLDNLAEPSMFALEECTDILHHIVLLLDVARQPAMACLGALLEAPRPREELQRLIDSGRVQIPEGVRPEVEELLQPDD